MPLYAIALGSNRRHGRYGGPARVLGAAFEALAALGDVTARSRIHITPALGPSARDFANAVALLETEADPPALLTALKAIERRFGRRRGRRWGARVLDLDIILWSGGRWRSARPTLVIPHAAMAGRGFVLVPLVEIVPRWQLPGSALTPPHLLARLTRLRPFHRSRRRSGP